DPLAQRLAFGAGDVLEHIVEILTGAGPRRCIIIRDSVLALFGRGSTGRQRELFPTDPVKPLDLGDAPFLRRIAADELCELADLEAGELPIAGIDVAAGLGVLVE